MLQADTSDVLPPSGWFCHMCAELQSTYSISYSCNITTSKPHILSTVTYLWLHCHIVMMAACVYGVDTCSYVHVLFLYISVFISE